MKNFVHYCIKKLIIKKNKERKKLKVSFLIYITIFLLGKKMMLREREFKYSILNELEDRDLILNRGEEYDYLLH